MAHAPDGVLRRFIDEPFAVADSAVTHVDHCDRCKSRSELLATEAARVHRLLAAPQLAPDVDLGWRRLQAALDTNPSESHVRTPRYRWSRPRPVGFAGGTPRLAGMSLRTGLVAGAVAVALAGGATAAATATGVFAPTHVAPLTVGAGDVQALASLVNLGGGSLTGEFPTPSGTGSLPFGTLHWSTTGTPETFQSLDQAEAATGMQVTLPTRLPAGVSPQVSFRTEGKISATLAFNSSAGALAGHSAVLQLGPTILAAYSSTSTSSGSVTSGGPVLFVLSMPRPTATTQGVTLSQVESFLLSRPGVPPQLATEIRLLGNIADVLPVPTPAGLQSKSVTIDSSPGIVLSDPSGIAAAAIFEDGHGMLHVVGGLVDQSGVLGVAKQLG